MYFMQINMCYIIIGMGRTNHSTNEMLNAVTKRAFNRNTPQTVDYQHLEAATTTSGLVSNRRPYSIASILANQFSLNAQNIVESNYDPFLTILLNYEIVEKTNPVLGETNTDQMSYAISCTDDRKYMAITSKFDNEVKVYEFNETLDTQQVLISMGTIDISGMDVDINHDGSETFVLKSYGGNIMIDKFDISLTPVSSTVLFTYSVSVGGYLNVSEDGNRVFTHHDQISRIYDGLVTSSYYTPTISNTSLKRVMSRNGQIVVALYASPDRIETYEIPATSPTGGSVAVQAVGSQNLGVTNFDLSYDGKVMVKGHSNTVIYIWNGIEWKVFQTIVTGLSGSVSVAINEYAEYFVVASSAQIKVYKLNSVYEQYGTTISGNFGTTGQTIDISKNGDKVIIGDPQASSGGSVSIYSLSNSMWTLIHNSTGSTSDDTLGKFVSISNNGDKYISGSENDIFINKSSTETISRSLGWSQRGNTISSSGTSLSLSNDGNNLVIGSPTTEGAMSIDGTQSTGSVKLYKFSGNLWSLHGEELLGDGLTDFGKYVSITSNGSKIAIGSDKNSVVQVYTNSTINEPVKSIVDSISVTPQGSSLEMSGDGNRLLLHGDVWDKNNDTWSFKDGIDQGDFMCLSNNGSYFSVGYNNIARLYGIDSNGIVSKIGEDILPTDSSSAVNTFRVTTANSGTSITVNAANIEMLNIASSYGGNTEICSLLWDSTTVWQPTINEQLTMQSVVSSGFTSPTKFGIALSRNGQALIIYDTLKFFVYSSGSSEILWNFERSKSLVGLVVNQNYNNLTNVPTSSRANGQWRTYTFGNITLPATWSNTNFQFKATVNGTLDGEWGEQVSITMKKQGAGTQPLATLNFNPPNQSSGISGSGGKIFYTNVVQTTTTIANISFSGSFSPGDVIDVYMSIYTTYWDALSIAVEIDYGDPRIINDMVISYDGSRIAYDNGSELVIEATIVGNSLGTINVTPIASVSFKSNTVLTVVRPNLDIEMYTNTGLTWSNDTQIVSGYSSPFLQAHTKWSGDGTRLAIGDSNAERVSLYEYDTSLGWVSHSTILGGGPTQEKFGSVIDLSNDGNTVIVGAPGDGTGSYKGYVKVYDYVSGVWSLRSTILHSLSDSSTTSGNVTTIVGQRNIGKSVTMSSGGNRFGYTFDEETQIVTSTPQGTITISSDILNRLTNVYNGGYWGSLLGFESNSTLLQITWNTSQNNGIWLPVTFGAIWSVSFQWFLNTSYGADDMRFIFYAPNQPFSYAGSQHGGYNVFHEFYGSDSHAIRTPTDSSLSSVSTTYPSNSFIPVTISYDNGVLTTIAGTSVNRSYTFTGSDLTAQQALWGTPTYIAISGRTGGQMANQYIKDIDVTWDGSNSYTSTTKSQASIRDSVAGSLVNPIYLSDDTTPTELVNLSEDRELEAISMSYDGVRYGIRATSGDYDAATQRLHRPNTRQIINGWTKRGDIISFTSPSMSFNSMSSSSDGNIVAFGYIDSTGTKVRVYGFSNNSWSQLGSDILPAVSNANEISIDISSDGTNLAVLVDPVTGNAVGKVFTYSSSEWSQNGSTIDFRSTGVNTIKLSGDGTTIAFGNNAPDSPFPFNIIRVYRKSQDWELISPTMTVAKSPSNYFGGGLSLTNDGSTLATFNNSGVEFSTFSTQTVSQTYQQYLNDITVSGATIDIGDLRLTDSGERLFVMSGDEKVRVYDSTHTQEIERGGVRKFSITKDGSSMVLTSDTGLTEVFNRDDTSWSQLGPVITTNMTGGGATVDIKNDGTFIVLAGSSDSLRLYKYDGGSWSLADSTSGQYGSSVFITDTNDLILGNSTNAGSVKTFEIRGVFQDNAFSAPTLSLNGDTNNRINFGTPYIELGATVTTNASTIPGVEISGAVFKDENGVYSLKYEAEDLLRKKADPIYRTVEVLPKLATIKLEGGSVIYHTQGTPLADPGVTTSIPVTIYHTTPSDSTSIVPGFPNFVTATTVGEYEIYYTNDTPDKYLRLTTPVKRSVHVRARPVLSLVGASTVYNPLGQEYTDSGASSTGTVSFNKPNVQLSQTQTVTYTTKDQFGIEAIPITREVIVRKRPTITTSGTLFRIRNDPITIPSPTVDPVNLTSSLQSSNNININENGTYTLTYNVTDGDGIPANTTRQSYNVGSYGNLVLLKTGYVSTLSKDGKTLAVYNTSVQIYKKELDGSWNESGNITTDSTVTSMAFTSDGRYIIIGSSSYLTIGIVRVYERTDSSENGWEQFGFEIYGVDYLGYFGHGVDINDDATRIIISAPEANTNNGTILKAGSLKVFDLQNNFWIQNTQVIEGLSPFELLGTSVSMSGEGDIIAIGSPGYTRTTVSGGTLTTSNVGKTSVYRYRDNVWGLMGNNIEDGTIEKRNAYSISLSTEGNSIVVGSESGGGVRVYNFRGEEWRPLGSQISGTFGKSVSLSGNTVVIGSEDVDNGRVHIYNFTDGDWSRAGRTFEKTIVAEGGTNNMGKNVNITSDGTSICVTSQSDVRIYSI